MLVYFRALDKKFLFYYYINSKIIVFIQMISDINKQERFVEHLDKLHNFVL